MMTLANETDLLAAAFNVVLTKARVESLSQDDWLRAAGILAARGHEDAAGYLIQSACVIEFKNRVRGGRPAEEAEVAAIAMQDNARESMALRRAPRPSNTADIRSVLAL